MESEGTPRLLCQWLRNGVALRWKGAVPRKDEEMRRNSGEDSLVRQEMKQLIKDGVFSPMNGTDAIVSPTFVIPKRTGGLRSIHDLRSINAHLEAPHFSLHGARDASEVVRGSN